VHKIDGGPLYHWKQNAEDNWVRIETQEE
jgi:hypothetical protein